MDLLKQLLSKSLSNIWGYVFGAFAILGLLFKREQDKNADLQAKVSQAAVNEKDAALKATSTEKQAEVAKVDAAIAAVEKEPSKSPADEEAYWNKK